jgi:hypothetical protein
MEAGDLRERTLVGHRNIGIGVAPYIATSFLEK